LGAEDSAVSASAVFLRKSEYYRALGGTCSCQFFCFIIGGGQRVEKNYFVVHNGISPEVLVKKRVFFTDLTDFLL
jgi:hypothetical protein